MFTIPHPPTVNHFIFTSIYFSDFFFLDIFAGIYLFKNWSMQDQCTVYLYGHFESNYLLKYLFLMKINWFTVYILGTPLYNTLIKICQKYHTPDFKYRYSCHVPLFKHFEYTQHTVHKYKYMYLYSSYCKVPKF